MADKKIDVAFEDNTKDITVDADATGGVTVGHDVKVIFEDGTPADEIVRALTVARERLIESLA